MNHYNADKMVFYSHQIGMTPTGPAKNVKLPRILDTFSKSQYPKEERDLKRLLFMIAHFEVQMFKQDHTWRDRLDKI